jgi:hypothetical protein
VSRRLRELIAEAEQARDSLGSTFEVGSFEYDLARRSFEEHIGDLKQQLVALSESDALETVEFRVHAKQLASGSVPLLFLSEAGDQIRRMLGFAALRFSQGGQRRKRVPAEIYEALDLRLAGVQQGSTRLIITSASTRDLFDDGLSKSALKLLFSVLETQGAGADFLEAITALGQGSARQLNYFLRLLQSNNAELDLQWRHGAITQREWHGTREAIERLRNALEATEVREEEEILLQGIVELLSKKERLQIRTATGQSIRVLFPKRLFGQVAELHLDQLVNLRCAVTETINPTTEESSIFYELLNIESDGGSSRN